VDVLQRHGARLVDPGAEAGKEGGSVKFCKDCKNYRPAISGGGGSLLPGFVFAIPAQCVQGTHTDLVTGEKRLKTVDCAECRKHDALCGIDGTRFDPATLDGRLAMLDVAERTKNIQ
jgi:hypothetical protein